MHFSILLTISVILKHVSAYTSVANLSLVTLPFCSTRPAGHFHCAINGPLLRSLPLKKLKAISPSHCPIMHKRAQQEALKCNQIQEANLAYWHYWFSKAYCGRCTDQCIWGMFVNHKEGYPAHFFRIIINESAHKWNRFALPPRASFNLYLGFILLCFW